MSDTADFRDVVLSSYSYDLRVKIKYTNYIKGDIVLRSRDEESALIEIKQIFDRKDSVSSLEIYYLRRSRWDLPIQKGADMISEEALLEIKKLGQYNWSVNRVSEFIKDI
jgi:hypothetical protein